jgi:hypothetical protein
MANDDNFIPPEDGGKQSNALDLPANPRDAARFYLDRGWQPIPLWPRSKKPQQGGWPDLVITPENVDQHFNDDCNVGVKLGSKSGNLIDIDLDCPHARALAFEFLPATVTFGRAGSPMSHRLYCLNDDQPDCTTKKFDSDPQGALRGMILELRGDGHYTVFPPSIHEDTGQQIEFTNKNLLTMPYRISRRELVERVSRLAAAALLVRHWPGGPSNRNEIAMAVAGMLLRQGVSIDEARKFIELVAEHAGDEEARKRPKVVADTQRRLDSGERATGVPRLGALIGDEKAARKIAEWLGGDDTGTQEAIDELNEKHCIVTDGGHTCIYNEEYDHQFKRWRLTASTQRDFALRYAPRVITTTDAEGKAKAKPLAKAWIEHPLRRSYEGIVLEPNGAADPNVLNLWRGWPIEPRPGDWSLLQDHILNVIAGGDRKLFDYILNWLAHAVQHPNEPAEVAIVLQGEKGTGKTKFCTIVRRLFGQHGLSISNTKHMIGHFNAHLRDCILLHADEAFSVKDMQGDSVLKAMITDPVLMIERKGVDAVPSPNRLHILISGNAERLVHATPDERRYVVCNVSNARQNDFAYFKAMDEQQASGGDAGMLHDLLHRDITGFHPRNAPQTKGLAKQKALNLPPAGQWWARCLTDGTLLQGDLDGLNDAWEASEVIVLKSAAYQDLIQYAATAGLRRQTDSEMGRDLAKYLPGGQLKTIRTTRIKRYVDAKGAVIEVSGQRTAYVIPPLAVCRAAFEKITGIPLEELAPVQADPKADDVPF